MSVFVFHLKKRRVKKIIAHERSDIMDIQLVFTVEYEDGKTGKVAYRELRDRCEEILMEYLVEALENCTR